jgi:hypothetical protein
MARHVVIAALLTVSLWLQASATEPVRFQKLQLTDKYYCDGVTTADINLDGKLDVVAGPFWYEGPDFQKAHAFYKPVPLDPAPSPSNSMYSFVHDFNGDGWPDILVLGRVHLHEAHWYENPGEDLGEGKLWKSHFAFLRVLGESPAFADVDGDGEPELVAHWAGQWGFIKPNHQSPSSPWSFKPITDRAEWPQFYHGTGVGDVNGDGRLDLILNDGWWEQPAADAESPAWMPRLHRFGERGGAQMAAYDVDGDGDQDIITSLDAHGWGLAWFEQTGAADKPEWKRHTIMGSRDEEAKYGVAFSQPHALAFADVNGDGLQDIVIGKRRWAHGPKGDIEPDGAPVVYWFELTRDENGVRYTPHLIDDASGVGVQIATADLNGDGRLDVLTASKLGVFAFVQEGAKE